MITTLTGDNSFGWRIELGKLAQAFLGEHGEFALERLDGESASFERLQESLQSLPFLASRKMVVLREPSANKQFVENVDKLLGGLPETTDVVIVEPKLDKRLGYYKLLKKATDFREFNELDENALVRWLVDAAKERGGSLSQADAHTLVERVGLNQQLLAGELEKLMLFAPDITTETISLLTDVAPQSTVFELLEAAFAGDAKKALALYHDQREQKVDPSQIIAMLAWQLRVTALLKTAGNRTLDAVAKEAKLSPFVLRKSQRTANGLSLEHLKRLVCDLLALDVRSKCESVDLDEALQHYLLRLSMQ